MRLRNIKNKDEIIETCSYLITEPKKIKGSWSKLFNNDNPIHIEIGMGKGNFIHNMALAYPNINFIGIEKYTGVVAKAIDKINKNIPSNLRLINIDALELGEVFFKEIDTIYLNFSDPWPKKRNAKRRLTSPIFLDIYDNLFKGIPHIVQKTDNIDLFASSIVELSNHGYVFKDVSLDLANKDIFNVLTEYESKFMQEGIKINYLDAFKER